MTAETPTREIAEQIVAQRLGVPVKELGDGYGYAGMIDAITDELDTQALAFAERMDAARRAVEFAGYMAAAAETFLSALNSRGGLTSLEETDFGEFSDHWRALTNAIYEFRKRIPLSSTGTTDGEKAKTPLPQARENVEGMDD